MGLISGSLVVVEFMHPVNTELNDTKIKKHREEVFTEILIDLWFRKWGGYFVWIDVFAKTQSTLRSQFVYLKHPTVKL